MFGDRLFQLRELGAFDPGEERVAPEEDKVRDRGDVERLGYVGQRLGFDLCRS